MDDDWSFKANLERGHLPTGEALEALYGTGPWTPEPEYLPPVIQCRVCGGRAYDLGNEIDCENCGLVSMDEEEDIAP